MVADMKPEHDSFLLIFPSIVQYLVCLFFPVTYNFKNKWKEEGAQAFLLKLKAFSPIGQISCQSAVVGTLGGIWFPSEWNWESKNRFES